MQWTTNTGLCVLLHISMVAVGMPSVTIKTPKNGISSPCCCAEPHEETLMTQEHASTRDDCFLAMTFLNFPAKLIVARIKG